MYAPQASSKWHCFAPCRVSELMGRMNVAVPPFLALELKIPSPHSSVNPLMTAINQSSLPGFHQNSVFTCLCLSILTQACDRVSKLQMFNMDPNNFPCSGSPVLLLFATLSKESDRVTMQRSQFMATQSRKPAPSLTVLSLLSRSYSWVIR